MYKKLYKLGFLVYAGFLILSLVFYKQRTINLDAALYLFNIVRAGEFRVEHFRFIALVVEIFPWLAVKLSSPLDIVMMSYSVGFVLWSLFCYVLCGSILRNYKFAAILVLYHILITAYTFYWQVSELILSTSLLIPVLAFIDGREGKTRLLPQVIYLFAIITITFSHPLMIFPLGFGLLFMYLHSDNPWQKKYVLRTALLFIGILVLKSLLFREKYDSKALGGLRNFVTLFPDYFNTHTNRVFIRNIITRYHWLAITFIMIIATYARQKDKIKLWGFTAIIIGYLAFVNTCYPTAYTPAFYIENLYLVCGFFLAFPLVYHVLPLLEKKKQATAFFLLIVASGLVRIYFNNAMTTNRLAWQRQFLKEHREEKLIVKAVSVDTTALQMYWASPYEFWLLSTSEYQKTASIIIHEQPEDVAWEMESSNTFITRWGLFHYSELDKRYFIFTDSSSRYRIVQ